MTIDVRAKTFCNLGVVIQASLADEALTAGQGLISCRGQVVIDGLTTPAVGSVVYFGWQRGSTIARIPRTLRVLSSFADPFRGITTVQLGDKLTYLANLKGDPKPTDAPEPDPTPEPEDPRPDPGPEPNKYPWQQYDYDSVNECYLPASDESKWYDFTSTKVGLREQSALLPETPEKKAPVPISANFILGKCLAALGIGSMGAVLSNQYLEQEFDLSAGYVSTIDKLLNSESLYGYLDENEILVIADLLSPLTAGPLINSDSLVDLQSLGVGLLPGQLVNVKFERTKLNPDKAVPPPPDPTPPPEPTPVEEPKPEDPPPAATEGTTTSVPTLSDGYCLTEQTWSDSDSICFVDANKNNICFGNSSRTVVRTCYDKDNYVTTRTTWTESSRADLCGSIVQAAIGATNTYSFNNPVVQWCQKKVYSQTQEVYTYVTPKTPAEPQKPLTLLCSDKTVEPEKKKVEKVLARQDTYRYEPADVLLSRLNISGIDWSTYNVATIPTFMVMVEHVRTSNELPETVDMLGQDGFGVQKNRTVTERFVASGLTQRGQQEMAELGIITENATDLLKVIAHASPLRSEGTEIQTDTSLVEVPQAKSPWEEKVDEAKEPPATGSTDENGQETASITEETTTTEQQPKLELQMPLASDDGVTWSASDGYQFSGSNAAWMALRYARSQNAILRGNRNGVALQLPAYAVPMYPLQPLYLQAASVTGAYRTNGLSWSMNADGILCNVDAMFWGGVSGTGTPWFPVAPGVVSLPADPAVTTGSGAPANSTTTPGGFDPTAPGAIWDSLPTEQPPSYEASIEPVGVIPPVNERVYLLGATRTRLIPRVYDYSLTLPQESATLPSRTKLTLVVATLPAAVGTLALSGQAAGLLHNYTLSAAAGSGVLTGQSSGYVLTRQIGTNAGSFNATGQDAALVYQRNPLAADAGSIVLNGQDADLNYTQASIAAEAGAFNVSGEAAGLLKSSLLMAEAGSASLSGQAATLSNNQSAVSLLYYTGTGSSQGITGAGFEPGFVAIKRRNGAANHAWFDHVRGTTKYVPAGQNTGETTDANSLTAFASDGFTVGSSSAVNFSTGTFMAWCLPKGGAPADNSNGTVTTSVSVQSEVEYSTFTYTGVGSTSNTLGHGLSGTPDLVIIKRRGISTAPYVGGPLIGNNLYYDLNSTTTATSSANVYQSFSSTLISTGSTLQQSGVTYAGWAFKAVNGISNIGEFTGGGSATHTVTLGYQPKLLILKNTSTTAGAWTLCYRPAGGTGYVNTLALNTNAAEATSTTVQFTSTGFSVDVGGPGNVSGGTTKALYWAMQ